MGAPTILVVEDEELVALDIERRLTPFGYAVITASSGEEAIKRANESRPDLVLMDIRLRGGMDGVDTAIGIRNTMDVPIIYLTAYVDEATVSRARVSEPYGYVLKPFDARELKATIDMALQRHWTDRLRREQEELQRFLADASARLAESLDCRTVVDRTADILVPRFADSCLICLREIDDFIDQRSVIYPDSRANGEPRQMDHGAIVEAVLASARLRIYGPGVDSEVLSAMLGREHLDALRREGLAPRSLLCVPLVARGRTLGAILMVSGRPDRRFGAGDVARAEDIARRLGMAIDNALLYREAQRAARLREEVLAVVAHDLRSPLSTILMRAEMLARGTAPPGTPEAIVRTTQRLNRLISDLLDAASIDAGRLPLERQTYSAAELALEAIDAVRPLAEEKAIVLQGALPDDRVRVICDRDRILQVLSNLIGNAIKFTPHAGAITVRAETYGAFARFAIRDTGPGMPPEQLPHLFERFWFAHAHREGTGLGLYIAKGIIEAHGGDISVESESGHGTTFFFTLPLASPAESHAPGP
jgi:signal transduction histidine kinase